MKKVTCCMAIIVLILSVLSGVTFGKTFPSTSEESGDKTLSPYFFVKSDDPDLDRLPLKSTSAAVNISGVIADVRVTQVYRNEGKRPLEAIYVFPGSTKAAVCGMTMTIGERVITARIDKREEARRRYEEARQQGRSASLLEQQRPNVFQMNVANIMPGDEIKVELTYTELLVPTDRVYEFVYPTVVGPRYSNQSARTAPPSEKWVSNPYLRQGQPSGYTFAISVNLAAGMPVKELVCTSHKVKTTYQGPTTAAITLDKSEAQGGNRDYVLRYRLDGDTIQSGLLLYEGEKENFFLLMMQPPRRVTKSEIPGREYFFVVDVSGSMHGFPLEISKTLLKDLISTLRPSDRFNLLLFSGGSSIMAEESLPATPENVGRAIQLIERQRGGGGTELLPALKRALSLPRYEGFSRSVVIATDGYVTVEEEVFDLIRNNLGDANMFAFGIGSSVNRHIIEGMARVGMGEPFVITKPDEAPSKAEQFRKMIESPVLTGVKASFAGFSTYDMEPMSLPDVLAERPVILFGKWRGKVQGRVTLSGTSGNGPYRDSIDVSQVRPLKSNSALRYLWARHRIALLSDYNKLRSDVKRIKEVTDLGLRYNLLTAYTSFVAIDTEVRNQGGEPTTVKQPLPLPQGVSEYAVGGMALRHAPMPLAARKSGEAEYDGKDLRDKAMKEEMKKTWRAGDVTVSGGLSKVQVLKVLEENAAALERSFAGYGSAWNLIVALTINGDGTVKDVKIVKGDLKKVGFDRRIMDEIKKWVFPAAPDEKETKATITLLSGGLER